MCGSFPERTWHLADMRTLALGRKFDGLWLGQLFSSIPETINADVPHLQIHAAAGAALMFISGPSAGEAIGSFEGEPLFHASLDGDEYRVLLRNNGFDVVSHVVADPLRDHTIWLARSAG